VTDEAPPVPPSRPSPLSRVRELFDSIPTRERILIGALAGTLLLIGFLGGGYMLYDHIDTLEESNQAMKQALHDIADKRGPYLAAKARERALESRIGQNPLQLAGFLEQVAKETGIEIRETNPRTPERIGKLYVQQSVDLRISKVQLEPLLKFARRLETFQQNLVLVTQISIRARDDKHQDFEVDLTVSTFEHAPKTAPEKGKKGDTGDKEASP